MWSAGFEDLLMNAGTGVVWGEQNNICRSDVAYGQRMKAFSSQDSCGVNKRDS